MSDAQRPLFLLAMHALRCAPGDRGPKPASRPLILTFSRGEKEPVRSRAGLVAAIGRAETAGGFHRPTLEISDREAGQSILGRKARTMRNGYKVLDADAHQMEPPGIWQEFIETRFRDRAPQLERSGARATMMVEGESLTAEGKYPFSTPDFLAALARGMQRFERARSGSFGPESRLQDMDEHGVDVQVLYPTVGGQLLGREFRDPDLLAACCRAYNDWSAHYCEAAPERLRWAAMLPLQQVDAAAEEATRAAAAGAVGFYVRPNPVKGRLLSHRDYFPLWQAIEQLDRPVCIHDSGSPHLPSFGDRMDTHTTGHMIAHPFEAMAAMMTLIWEGVFQHFPRLAVVHVEADAGWVPYWLQRMEQHYEFSGNAEHPDLEMPPTEYFKRNAFVACRGDENTLPSVVTLVGDDRIVFNTDYPHPDGTWPWGLQRLEEQPISADSKRRILFDNAAKAFRLAS
jgi:predicted TIM-barrel fold metal-dependent hydrolase